MNQPDAAIELSHVAKSFGRQAALDDVSLSVAPNAVFGFLGPNGAGKTTLIRLLLGLARPSSGSIRVFGHPIVVGRPRPVSVGALVEQPAFYAHLSASDNLALFSRLGGTRSRPTAEAIGNIVERVGLRPAGNKPVRSYSSGMRQRLGLALALLDEPPLVVLDEPTSGLDPVGIVDVRRIIAEVVAAGSTVFLSSHLLSEVELSCTAIAIIVSGRVVAQGTPDEVAGGRTTVVRFGDGADRQRAEAELRGRGLETTRAADATELHVEATGSDRAGLLRTLGEVGVYPVDVFDRRGSLEAAYVALTGAQSG
jgi:ABC-2 type transport system ATP-binding protein